MKQFPRQMAFCQVVVFPCPLLIKNDQFSLKIQGFQRCSANRRSAPGPPDLLFSVRDIIGTAWPVRYNCFAHARKRRVHCILVIRPRIARPGKIWPILCRDDAHAFIPIIEKPAFVVKKLMQHFLAKALHACLKHKFRIPPAHIDGIILNAARTANKIQCTFFSGIAIWAKQAMAQQQKASCLFFCDRAHRLPPYYARIACTSSSNAADIPVIIA